MRILAVDDDEIILDLLTELLHQAGFSDVTTARSAPEAKAKIATASEPFECFLLDIKMPGTNGIELCRWIRDLRQYHATPKIMVSAMAEAADLDSAFAVGATDYVTKPFDVYELQTRVASAQQLLSYRRKAANPSRDSESRVA